MQVLKVKDHWQGAQESLRGKKDLGSIFLLREIWPDLLIYIIMNMFK